MSSAINKSISQKWRKAQLFVKDYGFIGFDLSNIKGFHNLDSICKNV